MNTHGFTLRQLQYAVAVADERSFHRAAERCHVSQPSLSAQLAHLEHALGVRLFERDRRRVLFTPAGEGIVTRARHVLTEVDDLVASAARFGDPLAGTLRIGIIPTITPYLLPEIVPRLREALPALVLLWREERTEALLRDLGAGRLDAAVMALVPGTGDLVHEALGDDAFVLAGPPSHPLLRRRRPATLQELAGARVLLLEDGHCFREQALALCSQAKAREEEFRATSLGTLAQMTAAGAGVTLLPHLSLEVENRRGDLAIRRFAAPAPRRTIVLAWRKRSPLGEGLSRLAAVMREAYPRDPRKSPRASRPPLPR